MFRLQQGWVDLFVLHRLSSVWQCALHSVAGSGGNIDDDDDGFRNVDIASLTFAVAC